jgi:formylglycine-generating enzyme required for sulfatase activity
MKARLLLVAALVLMMSAVGYCIFPGDCNGDGNTDDLDFLLVIGNFGNTVHYPGPMIYIPAGGFQMGNSGVGDDAVNGQSDEFPQHVVNLSGYWIGKYEVTRGEYQQFMDANGYTTPAYWSTVGWSWKVSNSRTQPSYWDASQNWYTGPTFTQTDSHPVVSVSYYEAEAYCNWAGGHLPTEAQWEKAARWDDARLHANVYPWGDTWEAQKCNNWSDSLYQGCQTSPVGSYTSGASPYGCMDMAGNVWEWCKDYYSDTYYSTSPVSDPPGPSEGNGRVMRGGYYGGIFFNDARAALRYNYSPDIGWYQGWYNLGFRLARD